VGSKNVPSTIHKEYHIYSTKDKVWDALVNPETIEKWGGGKAMMNVKPGSKFSLWNGDIHGSNIEVVPNKKLVQVWYSNDDPNIATKATFTLTHKDDCVILKLVHEGVGPDNFNSIDSGWDEYYLGEIKKFLEA
jgi:Uncharacterized conserved protein